MDVSFVFPYVNMDDPVWQSQWASTFPEKKINPVRARELGMLKYLFRGIDENLKWIDEVVMLVNTRTQVPDWVKDVRIVTVDEFIPRKFLPIFNSNAVEMFLAKVPGLGNGIIYSNDDFFPVKPLRYSDYFTEDGTPMISFQEKEYPKSAYQRQCQRDWVTANGVLGKKIIGQAYRRPQHEPQAITRAQLKEASEALHDRRMGSITKVRDLSRNLSQYIYFDYVIASGRYVEREKYDLFSKITMSKLPDIEKCIMGNSYKWVILNDTSSTDEMAVKEVIKMLDARFPRKSKFEK